MSTLKSFYANILQKKIPPQRLQMENKIKFDAPDIFSNMMAHWFYGKKTFSIIVMTMTNICICDKVIHEKRACKITF